MNLTILTDQAREDVKSIEAIVNSIDECMKVLNNAIKQNIPSRVETKWSKSIEESWNKYYNNSIQGAMEAMLLSAANLQRTINEAEKYSNQ